MDDIDDLIKIILSDEKLAQSKNFSTGVYRDEPILKTAAQLVRGHTPAAYREMRKIAYDLDVFSQSDAKVFYRQGKFMENFQDDFDYRGDLIRYFPTYQSLTDTELRGYFSWRTNVRRGILKKNSLSFVYLYIYELLNQIGVNSPEEGFHSLNNFWAEYREIDSQISHYVKLWLKDYVVYHNLDKSLLEGISEVKYDEALFTLLHFESHSTGEVFSALNSLSSYNLEKSRLYKQYPDDMEAVVRNVFAGLSDYYNKNRKNGICEKFFGRKYTDPYFMFRSAVFYDRIKRENFIYEINDIYKYRCKNGYWSCERFFYYSGKNQQIGALLKTVDFLMRQKYGFKSTLKAGKSTKIIRDIICKEIDKYLEIKRRNSAPKIDIDLSKLHHIRKNSIETQNKLLTGDDTEETAAPEPVVLAAEPAETNLSDSEFRFLECLLYGKAYGRFVQDNGLMLSVLIDAINEKLFDRFSDTVIIFDGDNPEVIEDYIEELKGIIRQ